MIVLKQCSHWGSLWRGLKALVWSSVFCFFIMSVWAMCMVEAWKWVLRDIDPIFQNCWATIELSHALQCTIEQTGDWRHGNYMQLLTLWLGGSTRTLCGFIPGKQNCQVVHPIIKDLQREEGLFDVPQPEQQGGKDKNRSC